MNVTVNLEKIYKKFSAEFGDFLENTVKNDASDFRAHLRHYGIEISMKKVTKFIENR